MEQENCKKKVLILSYNWRPRGDLTHEDFERKLERDRISWENRNILYVNWGGESCSDAINAHIYSVTKKVSRVSFFRPVLDIFMIPFVLYVCRQRNFKPDTIISNGLVFSMSSAVLSIVYKAKHIRYITNLPFDLAKTRIHYSFSIWYLRLMMLLSRFTVDRFVVINETTQNFILENGVSCKKIKSIISDTITADRIYVEQANEHMIRERYGIPLYRKIILSVGRLEKEKGLDELIMLFSSLKIDACLIIVGDGKEQSALKRIVKDQGVSGRVIFAGKQTRKEIWNFYKAANVFVLLSKSEALGLVIWEAMYMNVPVIGSAIGGIKETIGEDGLRGYLWDSDQGPERFNKLIQKCLSRSNEITDMTNRAHDYVLAKLSSASKMNVLE